MHIDLFSFFIKILKNIFLVAIGNENGQIEVYDQSLSLIKSFTAHGNKINRIKQSPFSADFVATCSEDKSVKIWYKVDWNSMRTYTGHTNNVNDFEWIDQDTIASGSNNKEIQKWSKRTGTIIRTIITDS